MKLVRHFFLLKEEFLRSLDHWFEVLIFLISFLSFSFWKLKEIEKRKEMKETTRREEDSRLTAVVGGVTRYERRRWQFKFAEGHNHRCVLSFALLTNIKASQSIRERTLGKSFSQTHTCLQLILNQASFTVLIKCDEFYQALISSPVQPGTRSRLV